MKMDEEILKCGFIGGLLKNIALSLSLRPEVLGSLYRMRGVTQHVSFLIVPLMRSIRYDVF